MCVAVFVAVCVAERLQYVFISMCPRECVHAIAPLCTLQFVWNQHMFEIMRIYQYYGAHLCERNHTVQHTAQDTLQHTVTLQIGRGRFPNEKRA